MTVGHVMYFDPANYPPVINACRVQAARGQHVHTLGYYRGLHRDFSIGPGISEHYLNEPPGSFPRKMTAKVSAILRFRRAVERWAGVVEPSAVVAHELHGLWGASALLGRVPIVLHVHDMPNPDGGGSMGRLDRLVLARAIRLVPRVAALVMPEASRLRIAEQWWQFRGPSFVVPNCPTLGDSGRTTILRDLIRERTRRTPEWIVVRAGGAGPVHLIEETVRAIRLVPDGFHLCLIGCGDESYMAKIKELVRDVGVEERVHQFSYIRYDDLRVYLRSAHVGLAIYRRGVLDANVERPASGKQMEYVAAGIPSVVSGQESLRALVERTGAVVLETETPEAIAECLLNLTREPAEYRRLCRVAQEAHRSEYHYEHCYEPVCALMDSLAPRSVIRRAVVAS